jgi:hypothetical protein
MASREEIEQAPNFAQVIASMRNWLRKSCSNVDGYRITIDIPTVDEEARLRLVLKNEFEGRALGYVDLDQPLRIMGFDVQFRWPRGSRMFRWEEPIPVDDA